MLEEAMATEKRTTKPLSPELKALRAEIRAAEAAGDDPVRPVYKAMAPAEKQSFVRRYAA